MVKKKLWKRFLGVMLPASLVAFLIISISLTFGTSDAGKALSVVEGCIFILLGLYAVFAGKVNSFVKKIFIKHKKKAAPQADAKNGGETTK